MTETNPCLAESDPTLARVAETSLRMMAGAVTPKTLKDIQAQAQGAGTYPWEAIVTTVNGEEVDATRLVEKGLAAQRDWVERGGAAEVVYRSKKRTMKTKAKGLLAMLIVRSAFYGFTALMFVVLLILARYEWPAFDIYEIGEKVRTFVTDLIG